MIKSSLGEQWADYYNSILSQITNYTLPQKSYDLLIEQGEAFFVQIEMFCHLKIATKVFAEDISRNIKAYSNSIVSLNNITIETIIERSNDG